MDATKVEKVVGRLDDDYHRQGGYLGEDEVLQAFERFGLSATEAVEVRTQLKSSGVQIDGEGLLEPPSPSTDDAAPEALSRSTAGPSDDPFELFLRELGDVELLTPDEVTALSRRVHAGEQAAVALTQRAADPEGALAAAVQRGQIAKAEFVRANLPLVLSIARHYARTKSLDMSDLVQEGSVGLIRAVEKFDHTKGFRFSTYATYWIRQSITRALADKDRLIRLPVWVVDELRRIRRTTWALTVEKQGRKPSADEIAKHLHCDAERVQFFLDVATTSPVSLQDDRGGEDDTALEDLIAPPSQQNPETLAMARHLIESVIAAVSELKPKEQTIIRMRYGLDGGDSHTLQEIGDKFGVSRERIRQIESKVMDRLRHPVRGALLREFLELSAKPEDSDE